VQPYAAGAGGDGRGGINLNPARLGPFLPGPIAAAAREAGLLPVHVGELECAPAAMLRLGSSGEPAPWMGGGGGGGGTTAAAAAGGSGAVTTAGGGVDAHAHNNSAAAATATAATAATAVTAAPAAPVATTTPAATTTTAAAAATNTDWSAACVWCLPGVADVLLTRAPYLALEEAHRLAAGVVGVVELRGAALSLLPGGGGGGGGLLRDLERVAADVDPEGTAAKSSSAFGAGGQEIGSTGTGTGGVGTPAKRVVVKALKVGEAAARVEARGNYERLRLATAVRRVRREFESAGDAAAFAAATAALDALESTAIHSHATDVPRAALRVSGLRPSRRAAVAAAAAGLDAAAANRLTAEGMYDVTHPQLAQRHCAYSVGVAFVAEVTEDALVGGGLHSC
jgi:hypothetical protein